MGTQGSISRVEILTLAFRLTVVTAASYFMVKWMVKQLDPTNNQKKAAKKKALEQLNRVGIPNIKELSDYEMMIASHLVDPNEIDVSWENIAGLEDIIQELKETVILPIKRKDLFGTSKLAQAPKGVLLHGPPGCGKTLIAKATAREAGTRFINLDVSILVDKWYGESQKLATAVFTLALKIQPCIIFIDEIDSFLRNRNTQDHEATAMMKAQFMALWDGLTTDPTCTVIIMGATNRPHDLDRAILRRMPSTFHIKMPNTSQRHQILNLILEDESVDENVDLDTLAHMAEGFSGSDLQEMCRNASLYRVRDYMRTNTGKAQGGSSSSSVKVSVETLRPITMDDLTITHRKMKDSKNHCELNHL